jgi:hypothetical protein
MRSRPLTDEELEELPSGALDQLADAVSELKEANELHTQGLPNLGLATRRRSNARDSLRTSLTVYENLRREIEKRYQQENPV